MKNQSKAYRHSLYLACGLTALLLLGCGEEEQVHSYKVAKPQTYPAPKAKVRLLAAIVPQPDRTWFFKLQGPTDLVDAEEKNFQEFIRTVRFTDKTDKPLEWKAPESWRYHPGAGERYATFQVGPKEHLLELPVTSFPGKVGDLTSNVDRWAGQIGLKGVADVDIDKVTHEIDVNGVKVTLVDLSGPGGRLAKMPR